MTDNLREVLEAVADGRLTEQQALPLLRALTTPGVLAAPEAPVAPESSPVEEDTYPLSRGQAALWAIQQSAPGTTAYNLPLALRLRPDADPRHLQGALSAAVRRHPSLRISVRQGEDGPVQTVSDRGITLEERDLSHLTGPELMERIRQLIHTPFDLEHDPLHRAYFVRAPGEAGPLLLLVFHHLVTDGVTSHLLLRDLVADYETLARGGTPVPGEPATPYSRFVRWQRERLAGPDAAADRAYWARRLKGASTSAVLDRLVDHRRVGPPDYVGSSVQLELDAPAWAAVRTAARELRLTPFSVVYAAYVWLLHRYSGQDDICVMVPTDGRPTQDFDRTVGYMINPVVLRTACGPGMTVRELCASVHEELLDAEDHGDHPFAAVVDDLRREGNPDASFDIGFYLQQGVGKDLDMAAGQTLVRDALAVTQEGESDLVLEVVVREDRALVYVKYDPEQFTRPTVERFADHYRELLARMTEDLDRSLDTIEVAGPRERALLHRVNATTVRHPGPPTAVGLVLDQADRTPDATAVVDEDKSLTYRELVHRTEVLADRLRKAGVRPGALVGVAAERRAELVVALLAVHRAGAAYVPLDPGFPPDRLAFIVSDAGLTTVVTDAASAPALPPDSQADPVLLDEIDWTSATPPVPEPVPAPADIAGHTAYVLYTSGSTGRPKGVEITHGNLANFLAAMAERPGCAEGDRLLAVTTVSFDIAGLELLLPLTRGASVEIAPTEVARDGLALRELLERSAPTIVQATPATWQMLLAAGWNGRLNGKILCGGEALTPELAGKLLVRADEVWNMYGPTETTIWSSTARVRRHGTVSAGTPIANTRFHLLDEHRRPVPFGTVGELYIAGDGVARGYLGRPELTAEKFPDGGFLGESGRLFRTGDAARHLPDGGLEILGRLDRQAKLRGYRIELGEIEAALRRTGLVEEARVVLRDDAAGHPALIGFVQVPEPAAGEEELVDRLRERLAAWLPGYMVPARLIPLESLPRTPNAKIDTGPLGRLGLEEIVRDYGHRSARPPAPGAGHAPKPADAPVGDAAGDAAAALREELRGWVAEIARVPAEQISARRPIGDYGFDSIRFTRLSAVLRDRLRVTVAPTAFYGHPTLDALATHLLTTFPEQLAGRHQAAPPAEAAEAAEERGPAAPVSPVRPARPVRTVRTVLADPDDSGYPPVAIIGMGGRLPESDTLEEFWGHLSGMRDLVRPYPMERGFSRALFGRYADGDPTAFQGSFVRDVAGFDAQRFRISPREAAQMDPQHRLLLHAALGAVQDAGVAPGEFAGSRAGVFVGITGADYFSLLGHERETDDHFLLGNVASVAANRISHLFDLRGQSTIYDTACSSSLVAIHRAVRSLQFGDCDTALAGGANLLLSPYGYLGLRRAGMLSPDARCKTFDASADGYGRGEGVVLLLLKRLDRARADGDPVHGVIIGSAENHGGRTHSLTVPNPRAQADVVVRAHEAAGTPASVGYIETHGTGTALGDPIEAEGLKDAFARLLAREGADTARIALGSVKTNIGHLEAAAGVAGVVKVLLAMRHRTLPGLVHLTHPNPMLELDGTPFHLQTHTTAWDPPRDGAGRPHPRRAGVSSFGMGGSNVHVVLEEAEEQ
ncbi:amino acid adenylation domain-containing protein [Streptomyces sp. NPDC021212]|uniref:amino acid adenylation domain-containing protein n=1 Tax=Streptomyces sp. NPDC021212 TaxID=3365118 RepID=UPI0037A3AE29